MNERNKKSKWYSTPESARRNKSINLTLSPEALSKLAELAKRHGSRSAAVEHLILKEPVPPP